MKIVSRVPFTISMLPMLSALMASASSRVFCTPSKKKSAFANFTFPNAPELAAAFSALATSIAFTSAAVGSFASHAASTSIPAVAHSIPPRTIANRDLELRIASSLRSR